MLTADEDEEEVETDAGLTFLAGMSERNISLQPSTTFVSDAEVAAFVITGPVMESVLRAAVVAEFEATLLSSSCFFSCVAGLKDSRDLMAGDGKIECG